MMSDLHYAMTAPGTQGAIPLPPVPVALRPGIMGGNQMTSHANVNWTQAGANLPGPQFTNTEPIPVSNMAKAGRVPPPPGGSAIPGAAAGIGETPEWVQTVDGPTPPSGEDTRPYNPPGGKWKEL
jgi:hypothetical protein